MTLRNGRMIMFEQPYLDWVLDFRRAHGLDDLRVSME
jgi:hypothetical protein